MTQGQIGNYRIVRPLIQGKHRGVYQAEDQRQRSVLLRVMPSDVLQVPEYRNRLTRESDTVTGFSHPAILPTYEMGSEGKFFFIASAYPEGGTLADKLAAGRLHYSDTLSILRRIASALDMAHEQGIIHRNLRPAMIGFNAQDEAMLTGFGLPMIKDVYHYLAPETLINWLGYISPEGQTGYKSDIYSLGVILFEMLSGQRPYRAVDPKTLATMHRDAPIPSVRDLNPRLPVLIDEAIQQAMAKDPLDRPISAEVMAIPFASETVTASQLETLRQTTGTPDIQRSGRNPLLTVGGMMLLAFLICAGIIFLRFPLNGTGGEALPRSYSIAENGVSVLLPDGWISEDYAGSSAIGGDLNMTAAADNRSAVEGFFASIDDQEFSTNEPFFATMVTPVEDVPFPDPLVQPGFFLTLFIRDIPVEGLSFSGTKRTRVDGRNAAYVDFTGLDSAGNLDYAGRIVGVRWNGQVGLFIGAAPADEWEAFEPTFNAIINGLVLGVAESAE